MKKTAKRILKIDRRTWLRGEGPTASCLYRAGDGKKCCLGFAAMQLCGLTRSKLDAVQTPGHSGVRDKFAQKIPFLISKSDTSSVGYDLMLTNDSTILTDKDREAKIKEVFARHDIKVIFTH